MNPFKNFYQHIFDIALSFNAVLLPFFCTFQLILVSDGINDYCQPSLYWLSQHSNWSMTSVNSTHIFFTFLLQTCLFLSVLKKIIIFSCFSNTMLFSFLSASLTSCHLSRSFSTLTLNFEIPVRYALYLQTISHALPYLLSLDYLIHTQEFIYHQQK